MSKSAPHLLHVYHNFGVGGVEARSCLLINGLGKRYRHTILSLSGSYEIKDRLNPEVDVTFMGERKISGGPMGRMGDMAALIREVAPDIVLTHNWGTIEFILGNRLGPRLPHLHHEDGFNEDEANGQKWRRVWFRRFALRAVDALMCSSNLIAQLAQKSWRMPRDRVFHIPCGVDCQSVASGTGQARIPGLDRRAVQLIFGTVAALRPVKNLPRMVRGFAGMSARASARLVLIGDGPDRATVEAEIERQGLGEAVMLTGFLPSLDGVLEELDVFMITSNSEQMPNSVIEAMAAGLPVVGTDVGDIKHMLAASNRPFVVEREDEAALAAALDQLAGDPELRQRIGQDNKVKVLADYSLQGMLKSYDALLSSLLV